MSIKELQAEAFQDLWNLETLILTKNGIPKIKSDTFRNLPSLEKLKLDDNLIERLERRSFADLFALKELHLEQNIIKTASEFVWRDNIEKNTEIDHWLTFTLGSLSNTADFKKALEYLESILAPVTFLVGDSISIADYVVFGTLYASGFWMVSLHFVDF